MINAKKETTKKILEKYPDTRGDKQTGNFLNSVVLEVYGNNVIDFNLFNSESWVRARRKILTEFPELDERTVVTDECENMVRNEMR